MKVNKAILVVKGYTHLVNKFFWERNVVWVFEYDWDCYPEEVHDQIVHSRLIALQENIKFIFFTVAAELVEIMQVYGLLNFFDDFWYVA